MKESYNNHILSFIWLLFLILPNNQLFFLFVPVAYLVLFKLKNAIRLNVLLFIFGFVLLFFCTFLFNINEPYLSQSTKDISRLVVLILMFVTFGRLRGNTILKPYIYFAIVYLVISQFVYIWDIGPLKSLYSMYVDLEGQTIDDATNNFTMIDYGGNFRLGGIYFNFNQYARYLELIMLVLMCEIKQFNKKEVMLLFPIILFSLFATGSRTSLIVFCVSVIFYLHSAKVISVQKTRIVSVLFVGLLFVAYLFTGLSEMRAFKINEGMDDSFATKIGLLMAYLSANPDIIKIIFGNLTPNVMENYIGIAGFRGMDWEIGNLFLCYGILFFIFIFIFYLTLFKRYLPKYRVLFTILLWMFSSSVLCSYRMAALWLLVLGLYYKRSLKEKTVTQQ
jgi:hypothetical protein